MHAATDSPTPERNEPNDAMTTIEDIKTKLREIIELSNKATPGEWTSKERFRHSFEIGAPCIWLGESTSLPTGQQKHNASFVATSRNLTPKMAKALLGVIEWLESYAIPTSDAQAQLETIRREWEVQE